MLDLLLWLVEELTLFLGGVVNVGLVIVVGGGVDAVCRGVVDVGLVIVVGGGVDVGCSVVDVGLVIVVGGGVDVGCRRCC
jgi:hypothetical protein